MTILTILVAIGLFALGWYEGVRFSSWVAGKKVEAGEMYFKDKRGRWFPNDPHINPKSIGDVLMRCSRCNWNGTIHECEPDVDGQDSPGCPVCGELAREAK